MYVVKSTKEDKVAQRIFNRFRKCAPMANVETLKQISVYMARSGFDGDVYSDIRFEYDEDRDTSVLLFNNGIKIEFDDYSGNFDFVVERNENKYSMHTLVYLNNPDELSSVKIYSELKVKGYGMYVVTFKPRDLSDEKTLKYGTINFYTKDEIDWVKEFAGEEIDNNFDIIARENGIFPFAEKCEFDILPQFDMSLDCYQGYISNMLMRIDLLYDNMKYLRVKRKKKTRKRI